MTVLSCRGMDRDLARKLEIFSVSVEQFKSHYVPLFSPELDEPGVEILEDVPARVASRFLGHCTVSRCTSSGREAYS